MIWIIGMFVGAIVGLGLLALGRQLSRSQDSENKAAAPYFTLALGVVMLAMLVFSSCQSTHTVDYGNVGVVKTFGGITGQVGDGLQFTAPWQELEIWNTQTQRVRPTGDCYEKRFHECLEAFSSDNQDVFIVPTLNLRVSPDAIQDLARNVGRDYLDKIVRPRMLQVLKDEAVKYASTDIAPERETVRKHVAEQLRLELSSWSINVEDLLIENVDFRDEFKRSIEDKVIAQQNALAEDNRVAIAEAQAKQVQKRAEGEANKLRTEANGQADANRTITASLTPLLVQYETMRKLAPDLKIAILPAGQGIILDPTALLAPQR